MKNEAIIRKIVDHILLNACSVNSSGLYNGKAGMALALFEAARYLKDNEIEEKAYILFQESLIRTTNTNDYSFENGLSGIGYVLIYLIENKFLDADFDEIFKDQYEKIIRNLYDIDKFPHNLLNLSKIIFFLSSLKSIHDEDVRIHQIKGKIFRGMELYLSLQFFDWKDMKYINKKCKVLQVFETYLKLVYFAQYADFSNYLISSYADLYRSGRIVSSLTTGYYLYLIMKQGEIPKYKDVIDNNIHYGLKNIHPHLLSFEQSIEIAKMIKNIPNNNADDLNISEENIENIKRKLSIHQQFYGYQNGLARYLVFSVNKDAILL